MAFLNISGRYGEDTSVGKDIEFRIGSTPTEHSAGLRSHSDHKQY